MALRRLLRPSSVSDTMNHREREHVFYSLIIIGLVSLVICLQILRLHATGDIKLTDPQGHIDHYDYPDGKVISANKPARLPRQSTPEKKKRHEETRDEPRPTNDSIAAAKRDILPQRIIKTRLNLTQAFIEERVHENIRRRQVLNSVCDRYPDMLAGHLSEGALSHILVSPETNLLFCCVPQAGCTNWKAILMVLSRRSRDLEDLTSEEIHQGLGLRPLGDYPHEQQNLMLETFTKFMYVRNPFDRVFSAYKRMFENVGGLKKRKSVHKFAEAILDYHKKPSSVEGLLTGKTRISWKELTSFLAAKGVSEDDHFNTPISICDPCKVQYEYVGKLETVQNDAVVMLRELDVESVVTYPSRDKVSINSEAELEAAFSNLHPDVLTNLTRTFARDFLMFDYTPPKFAPDGIR